jgi:hypothetical protein
METKSADPQAPEIDERRREVALFRYGVIAELVQWEPHHRGLYALLAKKAEQTYTIPGSLRRHVAPETMRGWLRDHRRGGFDALAPRVRADQGYPMHGPRMATADPGRQSGRAWRFGRRAARGSYFSSGVEEVGGTVSGPRSTASSVSSSLARVAVQYRGLSSR